MHDAPETSPAAVSARLEAAVAAHRAGRLAEAARGYWSVLTVQPDQPDARHLLGVALRQGGHAEPAARLIAQALALAPDKAEAYLNRGLALAAAGLFSAAAASYRHAARLAPHFPLIAEMRRGPLAALTGWRFDESDDDIVCIAPGIDLAPPVVADLRARLRAAPAADVVFIPAANPALPPLAGADHLAGACPAGGWLAHQLAHAGKVAVPVAAVLRRRFVDEALLPAPPPPAEPWRERGVWGLAAAAAQAIEISTPKTPQPHPQPHPATLDDDDMAALDWLRRNLGRAVLAPAVARHLRRALIARLADALLDRPADVEDAQFAAGPVAVLARAMRSLPTPGTVRMARRLIRLVPFTAAAASAALARPPVQRHVHGLTRSRRAISPLYAVTDEPELAQRWDAWCYIGQSPSHMTALAEGALRDVPRVPAEGILAKVALRRRDEFLAAWGALLDRRPNRWAIMTAEQNPETSLLFLHAACVLTALELFHSDEIPPGAPGDRLLIVVEQPGLFHLIADNLLPNSRQAPWPDLAGELAENLWRHLRHFTREARRWRRRLTALAQLRPAPPQAEGADVVLVSYLDGQSFDDDGRWRDRYFGDLPDRLRAEGRSARWLWFDWTPALPPEKLAGLAHAPGWLYQELVGWKGVVAAMLEKINAWRGIMDQRLLVGGWDLTALMRMELRWSIPIASDIDRLLFRRIGPALARRGAVIGAVVFPYENQGWEKMLCAGLRRRAAAPLSIGYVHASFSPFHLSYYPPPGYWTSPRRPDRIVSLSPSVADHLAAAGYPIEALSTFGALRYRYLFEKSPPDQLTAPAAGPAAVLAVLPNTPPDAVEMFRLLVKALGDRPDRPVRLKPHPATAHRIAALLQPLPAHFQIIGGTMDAALAGCGVAVYAAGTTGLEILAAGLPVISLTPTGRLPYLGLPATPGGPLTYADSADDIRAAVDRYGALSAAPRQELARQARALALWWFSPPDPSRIGCFLPDFPAGYNFPP